MNEAREPRIADLQRGLGRLDDEIERAARALRVCDESPEFADFAIEIRREITGEIISVAMALICLSNGELRAVVAAKRTRFGSCRDFRFLVLRALRLGGPTPGCLGRRDAGSFLNEVAMRGRHDRH
jgi:hypothetical protein